MPLTLYINLTQLTSHFHKIKIFSLSRENRKARRSVWSMDDGSPPPPDLGFAQGNKKRSSENNGAADPDDAAEGDSSLPHGAARRRRDLVSTRRDSALKNQDILAFCPFGASSDSL